MTDENIMGKSDVVWAKDIATEFATRADGDFLAQIGEQKLIFRELVLAIKSFEIPVYARGVTGFVERRVRESEPDFPVGDFRLRRATAEDWYAAAQPENSTSPPIVAASALAEHPQTKMVDMGWVMKKAALIAKHACQWNTITADFHSASENGLSKAAKAPRHGEWFEPAALNWARQRGKLTEATEHSTPIPATPFSGLTHRI